jgi:hypothetical protein
MPWKQPVSALFVVGLLWPSTFARAQTSDVAELAVHANDVIAEHCAEIYAEDIALVARGYQEVAGAWEAIDEGYDDTGSSNLLYWRGVLAQCLGQQEMALADLHNFVRWTEGVDDEQLGGMVADADRRIRHLTTALGQTTNRATVRLTPREQAGATLLVSGGALAAAGFVVNVAAYQHGLQQTERDPFVADRNAGIAGLVVGYTGIGVAVAGVLTLALPERAEVSVVVGPVTSVGFRF